MENTPLLNERGLPFDCYSENNLFLKNVLFCVGFFIILIILGYCFFISAPKDFPVGQTIRIYQGDTLRSISLNLKENKIIRSRRIFEVLVVLHGGEKRIAIGDYLFENKASAFAVSKRLALRQINLASVKATIPEGFDVNDIADIFTTKLYNFNKEKFLLEATPLEGYLFPDTYFFFITDTEKEVLDYMRDNFEKKIKPMIPEIISSKKTEKEIVVMASIIEREASGDDDRGVISGILWNRISKGMPLQVDAAPDTYKTKGLPENPICNPGLETIKSAINPVKSNYLYYLHDKNGIIHYARTFDEHKINKQKYLK